MQLLTEYRRREAREATSWLACLTLRSPQDKKRATAHQHFICPEFDVKFRIETILQRALDCKCSETVDMVQANPNRNGDRKEPEHEGRRCCCRIYLQVDQPEQKGNDYRGIGKRSTEKRKRCRILPSQGGLQETAKDYFLLNCGTDDEVKERGNSDTEAVVSCRRYSFHAVFNAFAAIL